LRLGKTIGYRRSGCSRDLAAPVFQIYKKASMKTINRFNTFQFAVALLFLSVAPQAGAQSAKDLLVGTWLLISNYSESPEGNKVEITGLNPMGILMFDANGRISLQIMRSTLPKFASKKRQEGTPEENKAIVQGMLCFFGTYSVDETDHILNLHIEGSSFPNWNGIDQKRPFTIIGDELTYVVSPDATGGTAHVVWRRAK
jgi:Lipocalin-like domain